MTIYQNDAVTLYHGDCLRILDELPSDSVDAVITDPPYSSGGFTRSDRNQAPGEKYVQSGQALTWGGFSGDNRDGRSWCKWVSIWGAACLRIVKPSGYFLMFSDWRMLPLASDALQGAGWVWRGLIPWDKGLGSRAPHTGYFRHQCEYILWGTKGVSRPCQHGGPWPGVYAHHVKRSDKHHMTGKPTPLMEDLCRIVPPGGVILDPFAGSGTTLVAAIRQGRRGVGIEADPNYAQTARTRLSNTIQPEPSLVA
ncbi:MAG TPA: site-specific DNA-methyltransferase [Planctomycetota bacterium]|jgi:site-specific DNA-methyltransferase (adenine-specific)